MELPLAAFLGAFVAEHWPLVEQLQRQRLGPEAGDKGTRHPRRSFRAKRKASAAFVLKAIHFLGHDVGRLAQGAAENIGRFEDWRRHFLVTVKRRDIACCIPDMAVAALLLGQDVVGAARRL